ncbi:hypothetical protein GCM10022240_29260 [Microbacterium kribbense]|uniref:Glycosyltransferase RgtA/B/C/D-like domain-containing protein n=1 Tax=Microbacterium kribbense TaxID=433645 RepID=A0ABP7GU03_9MICO
MLLQTAPAPARRPQSPAPARRPEWLLPLGFGLVATVLAAAGSWIPSLWGDEAASLLSATRPLPSLFAMLGHVDAVHGTYYLGLHAWVAVFGTSPFALRFPTALAAGLCTAAVVLIARRLGTRTTAISAGVVCALLPRMTYAGEEARSYAFSAAIAAWLTLVLIELLLRRRPGWMLRLAYPVLLALGVYTFLYLGLMILAHGVLLLCTRPGRRFVRRWAISCAAALAVATPVIFWAITERHQVAYLAWTSQVDVQSVLVSMWFGDAGFATVAWMLVIVALAGAIVQRGRRRAQPGGTARGSVRRAPALELVAACWLIVPATLLIAPSALLADFTARYLTFCAPAAGILITCGVVRVAALLARAGRSRTVATIALTACVAAVAVPAYAAERTPYAKNNSDWAEISATMAAYARPGDGVVFDASVGPSKRPRLAMHTYPAGFRGLDDVLLHTPYTRSATWMDTSFSVPQAAARHRLIGITRVWLIEYATGAHTDRWGLSDLQHLGFVAKADFRTHRGEIIELTR